MSNPDYNLFDPEVLADPYALYKTIREHDPIYFDKNAGFWVVTRYQDVANLLRHPDISSDRTFMAYQQLSGLPEESVKDYKKGLDHSMVMMDPPQHTVVRKIANQVFTGVAMSKWKKSIEKTFNTLLDPLFHQGHIDFVQDVAAKFPAAVICEMFAIPEADREAFKARASNIADFFGRSLSQDDEETVFKVNESSRLNQLYLNNLIEERIKCPGKDMISLLIEGFTSASVDREQLISLCLLIITAGHITTINQLSNGVFNLLKHRIQWEELIQRHELVGNAVEEVLRYDTSVPFTFRVARENIDIQGKIIPEGNLIALGLAAANHDPDVFRNPDIFNIERRNTQHLTFAVGPHTCLGATLARLELSIAFESLARRCPQLKFIKDQPPVIKSDTIMFKGFKSLPLKV